MSEYRHRDLRFVFLVERQRRSVATIPSAFPHAPGERLLMQNSELRPLGIFNWTIPAWYAVRADGTRVKTCPHAGRCTKVCYALYGKYIYTPVKARHLANLEFVLDHRDEFVDMMVSELAHPRFNYREESLDLDHDPSDEWLHNWIVRGGRGVRIHDAGDFFEEWYLQLWIEIARRRPHVLFYAYSKEILLLLDYLGRLPENFRIIFSYGGMQDSMIDRNLHRHSDVFPTADALRLAGYYNQGGNDLLAVTAPSNRIGIVANNIPAANRIFAGRTMSELALRVSPERG